MNGLTSASGAEGAAAGLAGAGAGEGEVEAAGADGVCADAPDTRRGKPTSAPATKTRSIMNKIRPHPEARVPPVRRAARLFRIGLIVRRRGFLAAPAGAFSPLTPAAAKKQRRGESRVGRERCPRLLDPGRKPVAARATIAGKSQPADAKRHQRPCRQFGRRCISHRSIRHADSKRATSCRDRKATRIR